MSNPLENYFNEKDKYYINSQKYSECQLVSAINAAIYLDELPVFKDSIEYERLVDLVHARNGAAISVGLAHEYLRIICYELETVDLNLIKRYIDNKHPVEIRVHNPAFHSTLIIDYKKDKKYFVRVLNFQAPTDNGWIEWIKLKKCLTKMEPVGYVFQLDPMYIHALQIKNNQEVILCQNKTELDRMVMDQQQVEV